MRQSLLVAYQTYAHQTLNSWRTRPTWQIGVSVDVPFTLHPTRLDWNRSTRVTKRSEQWNQFGVIERRREHMEDALLSSVLHGAIPAINVDGIRNLAQTNSDVFFLGNENKRSQLTYANAHTMRRISPLHISSLVCTNNVLCMWNRFFSVFLLFRTNEGEK